MTWSIEWYFSNIQWYLSNIGKILSVFTVYWVIQLGRCVLFSVLLLPLLMIGRAVLKKTVFLKGSLWSLLLILPFLGKLRFFYETRVGVRGFIWWNNLCMEHTWVSWIYFAGVLAMWIYVVVRRRRLGRHISHMKKTEICGTDVYVSELAVSPFAFGLFRSRIVIPEIFLQSYGEEELEMIVLHEKTHIRLGHLWFYFIYDIWRALFFPNPLFTVCLKYFRSDMEDICDKVVIRKSCKSAYEYGQLLVKSIQMLKTEKTPFFAAFAGEGEYKNFKKRLERVVGYRSYRKISVFGLCLCAILILTGIFVEINRISYPLYTEDDSVMIYSDSFEKLTTGSKEELREAISVDRRNIYIKRSALENIFQEKGIEADAFYIGFGGYMKLPGMGGGVNAVYVDYGGQADTLIIPYQDNSRELFNSLFKKM